MQENEIMVSVCCLAYNHERYIRNALDSIIKQKTNFKYEIIIHDDYSNDNTPSILKEYVEKYSGLVKCIFQNENQYSKGKKISFDFLFPEAVGKYIAICECDDYWCDEYKLQKQFDAMEKNSNCSICVHTVNFVNENNELLNLTKPSKKLIKKNNNNNTISSETMINTFFVEDIMPFQSASFFVRKKNIDEYLKENPSFAKIKNVGDLPLLWYLISKGDVYYIDEAMSCYRYMSIGSWTNKANNDNKFSISHYKDLVVFFDNYNIYSLRKYEKFIDYQILKCEFEINRLNSKYKELLKRKYSDIFLTLPFKFKIKIVLYTIFPKLELVYKSMKKIFTIRVRGEKNGKQ